MTVILCSFCLLLPALVAPGYLDDVFKVPKTALALFCAALLIGLYGYRLLSGKPVAVPHKSLLLFLPVIVVLNFLNLLYTANPCYTQQMIVVNMATLALLYFTSIEPRRVWILVAIAAGGVLVSAEAWLQFFKMSFLLPWVRPEKQIIGTIGNSNYLGAYLIFPLFAMAGLFVLGRLKYLSAVGFLLILSALALSEARAAWVGCAVGFALFLVLVVRSLGIKVQPSHLVYAGVGLILLGYAAWCVIPRNLFDSTSLKYRTQKYWTSSVWLFKQNPIFGTGMGSYRSLVFDAQAKIQEEDPTFFVDYDAPKPEAAHNEYLEILNDGGMLAAGILLAFLVTIFRRVKLDMVSITALCMTVAIMVDAAFFFAFRLNTTLFMTAISLGMLCKR